MNNPNPPLLSLVIPCYNEAKSLPVLLERCSALPAARPDIEVILVDNGSTDESSVWLCQRLGNHPGCRALRVEKNQGYGFGILAGLQAAQGRIMGWTHADLQTDPCDAVKGLELFERAKEPERLFVKGNRYGRPLADEIFTIGMSLFETTLLGRILWDINAQPTLFQRSFFESWSGPPNDFALDLFAYYRARKARMIVERFPVRFDERLHGQSNWNLNWSAKRKFIRRTVDFSLTLRKDANR